MQFRAKRNSMPFICLICILLLGMCFGNIPADSFFAYAEQNSLYAKDNYQTAVIRSGNKTAPLAQIYEHKAFSQCEAALSFRNTAKGTSSRTSNRFRFNLCFALAALLSHIFLSAVSSNPQEFFQEIISSTVIISYIHRQDGQKSSLLFSKI